MINPVVYPITLYQLDDFDLQLNWRERCGATFDLNGYNARFTLWPTETDRTAFVYQVTNPMIGGNGIMLGNVSPNIWTHITSSFINFDPRPQWYVLELRTPVGTSPEVSGVWFRRAHGIVTYIV